MTDVINYDLEIDDGSEFTFEVDDSVYELNINGKIFIIRKDTYIHKQQVASSEWIIEHNLNKYPSVTIVDSGNTQVIGDVQYIDSNKLRVMFIAPFSGTAYLN